MDVRFCHACHAKRPWMCDCATPATHSAAASRATRARLNRAQGRHPVPWGACHAKRPRMRDCATPATQNDHVRLCHACHAQCRGVTRDQGAPKPGPRAPPSAMSAVPATQNDSRCEIVPRLPRETKVNVTKCHACHAECRVLLVCVCLCVRVWSYCVVCVWSCLCVCEVVCVCVCVCVVCVCVCVVIVLCVCGARDTESKTRTPHKDVGNKKRSAV